MSEYPTLWASEKSWARVQRHNDRLTRRMERWLRRRGVRPLIDPVGWDEQAQRVHDVTPTPNGLLHHSTCWCRRPTGGNE